MINIQKDEKKSVQDSKVAEDIEICLQCEGAFAPSPKKDKCIAIKEPAGPSPGLHSSGVKKLDYILEPRTNSLYPQNLTASDLKLLREAEKSNKVQFIQQALHKINSIASKYKEVNATIWLLKGDHFFFFCDEVVEDPTSTGKAGSSAPLQHNSLCALESMKASYPKTDNVNLAVRALACDSPEGRALDRARLDKRWFYTNCVKPQNKTHDERPVINVNGPDFYFNITKSAIFENVIFDGINAFGEIFTL